MASSMQKEVPASTVVPTECPFCGAFHARILEFETGAFYVRCRRCLGAGPIGPSPNIAAIAWNTRPMVIRLRKLVEHEPETLIQDWWEKGKETEDIFPELAGPL